MTTPFWISAFLDLPERSFGAAVDFWEGITGYERSAPRGDHREFATLVPPDGDEFLSVQRLGDGAPRVHLDLHVDDPRATADRATALGATEVADLGHVVMSSPGGLLFCLVTHRASQRPGPVRWPEGATSLVDQVCLDIPDAAYDEECAFWEALTGWSLLPSSDHPEFRSLQRPPEMPLRLLLQRLEEPTGRVRAHLDLACDDRVDEVRRHAGLGAELLEEFSGWTVLRDPAGAAYCITDRSPALHGLLDHRGGLLGDRVNRST